jgi:hypothetical protein
MSLLGIIGEGNSLLRGLPGLVKASGSGFRTLGMAEDAPPGDKAKVGVANLSVNLGKGAGPIATSRDG